VAAATIGNKNDNKNRNEKSILILMGYPIFSRKILSLIDDLSGKSNGV
jgi:hypothetical protein